MNAHKPTNSHLSTVLDALNDYLRERDMRLTVERQIVLNELCALPQPFTAEQLEEACRRERISRGTIYNTLKLMEDAHLLHTLERQRGRTVNEYELTQGTVNHMQVVCTKCGRVTDFHDKAITRLIQARKYNNFNMQHFTLIAYGECRLCRSRKQLTKK